MNLNCLIVDDQPASIASLSRLIGKTPGINVTATETDALAALTLIRSGAIKVDVLFLDINMPDIDGVAFARLVTGLAAVVFTTAYLDHAIDAFEVGAVDYLLKPVTPAALLRAIERVAAQISKRNSQVPDHSSIFIKGDKNKLTNIDLENIVLVEASEKYSLLYLQGVATAKLISIPLNDFESFLPASLFMRIHKSYIVSLRHIAIIEGNELKLKTGKVVRIGPSYLAVFNERISAIVLQRRVNRGSSD